MEVDALLLDEQLRLTSGRRRLPEPASDEVRIEVERSGICGSDLHALATGAWITYWPATLGHEVVGRVATEALGAPAVGTRVVLDSRITCHSCRSCAKSARYCEHIEWLGESRPGGYAAALNVPVGLLVPVPSHLGPELAVLAEPLAVAVAALDEVADVPQRVAVLGFGPVGALTAAEAQRRWPSAVVTVAEPEAWRARRVVELGFRVVETASRLDPELFDLVVDAAGYRGAVRDALRVLARGGQLLLVGIGPDMLEVKAQDVVEHGWKIIGSIGFDDHHLPRAVELLATHGSSFDIVTHTLPFRDVPAFIANNGHREALKVTMEF